MDIETLRSFCLSLPAVTESVKWGNDLVFSIGDKMFCVASLEPPFTFSFKVPDHAFDALSCEEGFAPAPYMARAKWVLVTNSSKRTNAGWEAYLKESYELVKAKLTQKSRRLLGI